MTKILLYGLQRSGTNILETLLKKNFKFSLLNSNRDRANPIQKHFRLYDDKNLIPEPKYNNNLIFNSFSDFEKTLTKTPDKYIIISKDTWSWYLSYLNWAEKCKWEKPKYHYIQEYNEFYKKWFDFSKNTDKIMLVKYIDLSVDTVKTLNWIQNEINLSKRRVIFSKNINKVSQSSKFTDNKKNYYTNKEYMSKYSKEKLEDLNDLLDYKLLESLGYN